jgi:hypothetical protein
MALSRFTQASEKVRGALEEHAEDEALDALDIMDSEFDLFKVRWCTSTAREEAP